MKHDTVGNEVRVNDIVLVAQRDSNHLFRARVVKNTSKGMKCEIFDSPAKLKYMDGKIVQRLPNQIIKILDGNEI